MEPPVTPKPMPASSPDLPTNHTSKLFGIVGGGHHYTGCRPVVLGGEVCFLPSKVSSSLVVGPARKNPGPSYPQKQRASCQDWVPDKGIGVGNSRSVGLRSFIKVKFWLWFEPKNAGSWFAGPASCWPAGCWGSTPVAGILS
ncbi:hypothetical protein DSO57_1028604 [Entomophthora muscae]|uniref:Uncharacterized protein n=1 Tax=Entomophthora muscae TaxID=34485 RepID=A0ACC2SE16_9FUNG|nr:hypothetical protein DSO57_1028604 [Entomophthora muscae]